MHQIKKNEKKGMYVVAILFCILIIAVLLYFAFFHRQGDITSTSKIFQENPFTIFFLKDQEKIEFCNYNKVESFLKFYQEKTPSEELSFDELSPSKTKCPGTIKKVGSHFVFEPDLSILKNVKDAYTLNAFPDEIKTLDESFIQRVDDGYFLYGYDRLDIENNSNGFYQIYLLKYGNNHALEWFQKIATPDIISDSVVDDFNATIHGIFEQDGIYSILYTIDNTTQTEQEREEVSLYLSRIDQKGNLIEQKKLLDYPHYYLSYLGIMNGQFLLQQEDIEEEQFAYFAVTATGEVIHLFQTKLEEQNSYLMASMSDGSYFYEWILKEENDQNNAFSQLRQYDREGNIQFSTDLTTDLEQTNLHSYNILIKGKYCFLYNKDQMYIYDKSGKYIQKMNLKEAEKIEIDYDDRTNQYYLIIKEADDTSQIHVYDSELLEKKVYSYEQRDKILTFFQTGKLYTTSFTEMHDKHYQILSSYTFT